MGIKGLIQELRESVVGKKGHESTLSHMIGYQMRASRDGHKRENERAVHGRQAAAFKIVRCTFYKG